jgi:hypothetical protein
VDQVIEIQYKSGEDESLTGADLENRWEQITDTLTGIQYAVYMVPNRRQDKLRVAGIFGEPRDEHADRKARERQADKERQQRDLDAMIARRDWTYNGSNPNHF